MNDNEFSQSFLIPVFLFVLMMGEFRLFSGISGMVSFTVLELAVYISICYFFLAVVANPIHGVLVWRIAFKASKWVMLYAFVAGVGAFLSLLAGSAFGLQAFKDLLPACLLVPVLIIFTKTKKQLFVLFILLISLGLISAGLGVLQGLLGWPYIIDVDVSKLGKMSLDGSVLKTNIAVGFFSHPNGLGLYLIAPVCALAMLAIYLKNYLTKLLCIVEMCIRDRDMAEACVYLLNLPEEEYKKQLNDQHPPLINIGTGVDMTIRELATTICDVVGFKGELVFDASKPDGTMRKLQDVSKLNGMGWQASMPFIDGLTNAYSEFSNHLQ